MTDQPPPNPGQPQPGWPQQGPQPYGTPGGQQPYPGPQHAYIPPAGQGPRKSWPARHKVLTGIGAAAALLIAGSIGASAGGSSGRAIPAPAVTVTMVQHDPQPAGTVTVTATATVTPTANAQGQATQISADGVYVVGTDIAGGTWHTSGGQQCYEATLGSTDTSNIINNNNYNGPDTVSLAGAKAFDISGGCTWRRE